MSVSEGLGHTEYTFPTQVNVNEQQSNSQLGSRQQEVLCSPCWRDWMSTESFVLTWQSQDIGVSERYSSFPYV